MTLFHRRLLATLLLALFLLLLAPSQLVAEIGEKPAGGSSLLLGDCRLSFDPEQQGDTGAGPLVCLRAAVGAESTSVSGTPEENSWIKYGSASIGAFPTSWLALQGRGHVRTAIPLNEKREGYREAALNYAVIQVGNPVLSPVRITAGRLQLPFGIDRSDATEQYQSFEDRRFWASPHHGAYLTLDNRESVQAEFGFATNQYQNREIPQAADEPVLEEPLNTAVSLRLMADYSALDGSRIVISGYEDKAGVRRIGGGFLTLSRKEDLTSFEYVRRLSTPKGQSEPFTQLLRAAYASAWRGDTRWVVQFDDERLRFRRGTVGADVRWTDYGKIRLGVAYHKSELGDGLRRWYVTTGIEAHL